MDCIYIHWLVSLLCYSAILVFPLMLTGTLHVNLKNYHGTWTRASELQVQRSNPSTTLPPLFKKSRGSMVLYSLRGRRKKGRGRGEGEREIPLPFFPSSLSPTPYPFRRLLRRLGPIMVCEQIIWGHLSETGNLDGSALWKTKCYSHSSENFLISW